jgi:hypothetical protein
MIYERDGDRLRIAYFDGREARPTGFAPERKLVVTTLIPTDASRAAGASLAPRNDPCAILRAAGADAFLGGARILTTAGTPDPSASCKVEDAAGLAVTLLVVRAAIPSILERERAKAVADSRNLVQEEALGAGAFSSARGNHTIVWAQKGDTLVALAFIYPPSNRERLAQFARRVLAEL